MHPLASFKNEWIDVDVDEQWSLLVSLPEEERINELCNGFTWDIILDDFNESPEFKEQFKKNFFTPSAIQTRMKALYGVSAVRNNLTSLIDAARAYEKHILSFLPDAKGHSNVSPLITDEDGREWDAEMIGTVFARLVSTMGLRDLAKQFTNLADAEKTRARNIADRHEHTNPGLVLRAFCELIMETKRIPDQNEIDAVIHRKWNRSVDVSQMGRICKSLGISRTNPTG